MSAVVMVVWPGGIIVRSWELKVVGWTPGHITVGLSTLGKLFTHTHTLTHSCVSVIKQYKLVTVAVGLTLYWSRITHLCSYITYDLISTYLLSTSCLL